MAEHTLDHVMDQLYTVMQETPVEDMITKLVRTSAITDNGQAIYALATILMIENTRRRHAEARYSELRQAIKKLLKEVREKIYDQFVMAR